MSPDPELPLYASRPLTPRQDRIESTIQRVLSSGGTRSELRDAVYQYADHVRMQQVPPERALQQLKAVAMRSMPHQSEAFQAVGDSLADRLTMMVRWCTARYYRVD